MLYFWQQGDKAMVTYTVQLSEVQHHQMLALAKKRRQSIELVIQELLAESLEELEDALAVQEFERREQMGQVEIRDWDEFEAELKVLKTSLLVLS
jgi:predicted DNA-binding protein